MRILVAVENITIQGALVNHLSEADYVVETASTVAETISKIEESNLLDAIILEMGMEGGTGLRAIDSVHEGDVSKKMNVIVLKSFEEQIPRDNSFIRAIVDIPFTGAIISDALIQAISDSTQPNYKDLEKNKTSLLNLPRFSLKLPVSDSPKRVNITKKIFFGTSYVFFESTPNDMLAVIKVSQDREYELFIVSSNKEKAARRRYKGLGSLEIISLAIKPRSGYYDVYKLGLITDSINTFIQTHDYPVIVFDDLDMLIVKNGFSQVMTMMSQILKTDFGKKFTILVSVDVRSYNDKDKGILQNMFHRYDFEEEIDEEILDDE